MGMMLRSILIIFALFSFFIISLPTQAATSQSSTTAKKQDAVGGETGKKGGIYVVGRGFKTAGHEMEGGFKKAGHGMEKGFKTAGHGIVKGGKATGHAFQKAGHSTKNFFTGHKD